MRVDVSGWLGPASQCIVIVHDVVRCCTCTYWPVSSLSLCFRSPDRGSDCCPVGIWTFLQALNLGASAVEQIEMEPSLVRLDRSPRGPRFHVARTDKV